jgi:hypothetical protein
VQRNWDLAQFAVFLAGYKNNVVALAQCIHSQKGDKAVCSAVAFAQWLSLEPNRVNLVGQTRKV